MITRVTTSGAVQVAQAYTAGVTRSDIAVRSVVRKYGALLETRIKAKASGRPGPNAPTGDYRRSWGTRYFDSPGLYTAQVGTNKPQGRRLELGFVGTDSLGRTYSQPPYPHVGPAVEEIRDPFAAELGEDGIGL